MRETKAIIHLDNFCHNIKTVRAYTAARHDGTNVMMCVPVKADAYGHGAVTIARTAIECGVRYLAVAAVSEAMELRQAGISVPLLVLSIPAPSEYQAIAEYDMTPLVADSEMVAALQHAADLAKTTINVHLKIDSGMGRIGCFPEKAAELAKEITAASRLNLDGVCTHLSVADSPTPDDDAFTHMQITRFSKAVTEIRSAGINPGIVHASSSGGILRYPDAYFDMIRPGILVYGYYPDDRLNGMLDIRPVMSFTSYVSSLRFVPAGTAVSYGRTWTAKQDTWLGTIPAGYADGWSRLLSNRVSVSVNGKTYPVVGRICMDQCMVDFGAETDVKRWDTVTLFGPNGANSASGIANILGTIPYEVTCNVAHRVPRIYQS